MVSKIDSALPPADGPPNTDFQRKRLQNSCREFESILTGSLLKSMRESLVGADDESDRARGLYEEMLDNCLAKELSRTGDLGAGDMLYGNLERLVPARPLPPSGSGNGEGPLE
jgi:Rod binding domain-containing protein